MGMLVIADIFCIFLTFFQLCDFLEKSRPTAPILRMSYERGRPIGLKFSHSFFYLSFSSCFVLFCLFVCLFSFVLFYFFCFVVVVVFFFFGVNFIFPKIYKTGEYLDIPLKSMMKHQLTNTQLVKKKIRTYIRPITVSYLAKKKI